MASRILRTALTVIVTLLIIAAVVLCVRQFLVFSGQIATQKWAEAFDMVAKRLVLPLGQKAIRTPYHGLFDVNNAISILVFLAAEWGLSVVRDRA